MVVRGVASYANGAPPPQVGLFTYRLSGTITGDDGRPVQGATVVTRTLDRDFWTFSQPSNANGRYVSFFTAADKDGDDPVPFQIQVAAGRVSYSSGLDRKVTFKRLRSATLDLKLPAAPTAALPLASSAAQEGAIYQGLLVGVSTAGRVVKPLAARWPDRSGRFSLVLPARVRGRTVRFWQGNLQAFSRVEARPGGPVDLNAWPVGLSPRIPRDTAVLRLPPR